MKISRKWSPKLSIAGAALLCLSAFFALNGHAKSCHAASANGRAGLSCGPAPVTGGVSQPTGQHIATRPGQSGSPGIQTSNELPTSEVPIDPKPKPTLVQVPDPTQRVPNQPPPSLPPPITVTGGTPSGPVSVSLTTPVLTRPRALKAPMLDGHSKAMAAPLIVSPQPVTVSKNDEMITQKPGRQDVRSYPAFSARSTGVKSSCVVSGMERRRTVDATGVETYQGTLPTFRMVTSEVTDLPAWHPMEAGCVISVTHLVDTK